MTIVCEIFKEFGDMKEHPFDIKQLMKTLKIEDWKNIVPFRAYLIPLLENLTSTREELLQMNKRGHLLIKYIVEDNKELQTRMKGLVNCDNTVQWLLGDELKQDQFKFLYDTINVIYESALRDRLLNTDQRIVDSVIPKLTAYRSIMRIRDIQLTKEKEAKAEKLKAERQGASKKASTVDVTAEDKDMSKMSTKEIMSHRLQEEEKDGDEKFLTEQ